MRRLVSASSSPRAAGDPEVERGIVDLFADLAEAFGFPRSYGQIYGLVYASPRPLSFTDIQQRLRASKGSVSQGLRALRTAGVIRPADGPDWRREHFVPETELRQLIGGFVEGSVLPRLEKGAKRVAKLKARARLDRTATEEQQIVAARIEKLNQWHRKAAELLPLAARFLG